MSIEGRMYYRSVYLQSERWKSLRLEVLVRERGKCQICGDEAISNDAHHIWYPENIWDTTQEQLVVLCRPCHNFLHSMMPECKTNDEQEGRSLWLKFSNAILVWRKEKIWLFSDPTGELVGPKALRKELERLKSALASGGVQSQHKGAESEYNHILETIKKWGKAYAQSVKFPIE